MNTISQLIEDAADGAENDSAIGGEEARTLKDLAKLLKRWRVKDVASLKQRLENSRVKQLEGVIEKLRKCYNWDRNEYQSHPELVAAVEEALTLVRKARR